MGRHEISWRWLLPRRPPPLLLVFVLVLLCHGAFAAWTGATLSPDSRAYDLRAQTLIDAGFDFFEWHSRVSSPDYRYPTDYPTVFYAVFVAIVALLKLCLGSGWSVGLVALNLAADAALGVLLVRMALRLTAEAAAGWAALLLYLICFEVFNWPRFALSDTTFALLSFSIFTMAAARVLGAANGWIRLAPLAIAGVFYRPTGMVLLPDLALAVYLSQRKARRVHVRVVAAATAAIILGGVFLFAWLVQDPSRWPFHQLSGSFHYTAKYYAIGEVVSARPSTYHEPPTELFDFVLISADRFVHFFAVGVSDFSKPHWLVQTIFFVPCYTLALWLTITLLVGRSHFPPREQQVFFISLGAILAYALFHGLVQVDFDWRYRLPVLPHMILLAAGGAADLVQRFGRCRAERYRAKAGLSVDPALSD